MYNVSSQLCLRSAQPTGGRRGESLTTQWQFGGGDLGIPFWSPSQNKMFYWYGDTNDISGGLWRSNVLGYGTDLDGSDGLALDGFISNQGIAAQLINSLHNENITKFERSRIPTGAIEIDGTMYVFFFCVRYWGKDNYWDVNFNGVSKSVDGGQTWTRVLT